MVQSAPNPIPTSELLSAGRDTLDRLMPEVYDELRDIARRHFFALASVAMRHVVVDRALSP